MSTVLKAIHFMVAVFNTVLTFLCVDVPLKVILCIIFLILGLFLALIYPLVKNTYGPDWIGKLYDYATIRATIAAKVWEMWKP